MRSFGVCLCMLAACALLSSAPALAKEVHVYESSFGSEGAGPGQFSEPAGVAVNDVTHDVYVVDRGNGRVEEFNSTGSVLLAEFNGSAAPTGALSQPSEIAVDNSSNPLDPSREDVYVVDSEHGGDRQVRCERHVCGSVDRCGYRRRPVRTRALRGRTSN